MDEAGLDPQTQTALYNYLLNNNLTEAFTAISIGSHLEQRIYQLRQGTQLLQAVLNEQSTDDLNSTTARYIRLDNNGNRYRVNVNFPERNPAVPQPDPNVDVQGPEEEVQNDEVAAQQGPGADFEGGDADQAIPDQDALNQDDVAQADEGAQVWDVHAAEIHPGGDEQNANEAQIQAQPGLIVLDDLVVPPRMSTETALLYMTRLKERKDDLVLMKSMVLSLVGLEEPEPIFKKLWLLALYNRTEIHNAYSILTMATFCGRKKHKRAFFDSMFKLEDDVIVQNDVLDFVIPQGMKKSTALSCWFMIKQMRASQALYHKSINWLMEYDDRKKVVYSMRKMTFYNKAGVRFVFYFEVSVHDNEVDLIKMLPK